MNGSAVEQELTNLEGALLAQRHDVAAVRRALSALLAALAVEDTAENCRLVDSHIFSIIAENDLKWLPEPLRAIVEDMGGTLHDTHEHPEIARNFFSTPAQLLERFRNLDSV